MTSPIGPGFDINGETYPFDLVVDRLDRAAYLHFHSSPARPAHRLTGATFAVSESLRRFDTPTDWSDGITSANIIGETVGLFDHRWVFIPDDAVVRPDTEPEPALFDPSRCRRFVMAGSILRFPNGDGFHGFGAGMTWPDGGELLCGAVGTVTHGMGRLQGMSGTYTYIGTFDPATGFRGSVMLRFVDPHGRLSRRTTLPLIRPSGDEERDITYLTLRGQKRDRSQATGFIVDADGSPTGLSVHQLLRLISVGSGCDGRGALFADTKIGPVIGEMDAQIQFDLASAQTLGSNATPIPFLSRNRFTIHDRSGGALGTIEGVGGEGRTFLMPLEGAPRQAALRFGAFQPIVGGTGWFEGVEGTLTDNSAVGLAPHAITTLYVLRLRDPRGRFRTGLRGAWC